MKGGKDGAVIAPRNPDQSLLLHESRFPQAIRTSCPPEGRTPLTADEIAALRAWILARRITDSDQCSGSCHRTENTDLPLQPVGDYSYLMNEIHQMHKLTGRKAGGGFSQAVRWPDSQNG